RSAGVRDGTRARAVVDVHPTHDRACRDGERRRILGRQRVVDAAVAPTGDAVAAAQLDAPVTGHRDIDATHEAAQLEEGAAGRDLGAAEVQLDAAHRGQDRPGPEGSRAAVELDAVHDRDEVELVRV